jgi:hypothetical protein
MQSSAQQSLEADGPHILCAPQEFEPWPAAESERWAWPYKVGAYWKKERRLRLSLYASGSTTRNALLPCEPCSMRLKRTRKQRKAATRTSGLALYPDEIKPNFHWPTDQERQEWQERRPYTPIAISPPQHQLSQRWNFYRIFEAFEDGEYDLLSCEMTAPDVAEMRIETWAYPYGGLGCMIAMAEAFGFEVLGVNECGRYEGREELPTIQQSSPPSQRRWWEFWKPTE